MKEKFSNYILKVTSFIFKKKDKLRKSSKPTALLVNGSWIMLSELYLIVISLPTYLFLTEGDLKKKGFDKEGVKSYQLRKKVSLSTIGLGAFFVIVRLGLIALTGVWLGRYLGVEAATVNWDLASSKDYVYSKSIQITEGMAVLKKDKKSEECSGYVYSKDSLSVQNLESWDNFLEIADPGTGTISYQVSLDNNLTWLYWNGSGWVSATDLDLNTATEVATNIGQIENTNSELTVKATLSGSCAGDVKLLDMGVSYEMKKLLVAHRNLNSLSVEEASDSVLNSGNLSVVDGAIANAIEFDGVKGAYMIANTEALNPEQISVVIWANPVENRTAAVVDKGGWKSNYAITQDKWDGWKTTLSIDGEYQSIRTGGDTMSLNEWNLVVLTYDGSVMKTYVNAQLEGSLEVSGFVGSNTNPIYIGSEANKTKFFKGILDDFRVYNHALTPTEISEIYSKLEASGGGGPEEPTYEERITFNVDEGNGLVTSDSVGSEDLSLSISSWVEGIDNYAVRLQNVNGEISGGLDFIDTSNSVISFWIKPEEELTGALLQLQSVAGGDLYYLGYPNVGLELDKWQNIIVTLQEGVSETYLDGVKVVGVQGGYDVSSIAKLVLSGSKVTFDEFRFVNDTVSSALMTELSTEYQVTDLYDVLGTLEGVIFVNESNVPVTETSGYLGIQKNAEYVGEIVISDDLDTSVMTVDIADKKAFLRFSDKSVLEETTLMLPKTDSEATIRICPNASNIASVVENCSGQILLSAEESTNGVYSLIDLTNENYWYISASVADFSAGVEEVVPVVVIPTVTITTPDSGRYISGTVLDIEWEDSDTSGIFDITYSTDGFTSVDEEIVSNIEDLAYSWSIPVGINGNIQLRVVDSSDVTTFDISNEYLEISDPLSDTVIRWRFDEASGCEVDDDSSNYPGVLGNNCTSDVPSFNLDGLLNSSLAFDNKEYVEVDNSDVFNPTNGLTISAWVRWNIHPEDGESWAQIVNKNGDNQYQIQHNRANTGFEFALKTTKRRKFVAGNTSPVQGEWYLVTATYDGSIMKLYVNGELDGQTNQTGDILSSDAPLLFGKHLTRKRHFEGDIDEVRFYNYPLDQGDIVEMYNLDSNRTPEIEISSVEFEGERTNIEYVLTDEDNDYLSIVQAEYTVDDGENWLTMTPDYLDERYSGNGGLLGDDDGEVYNFVWNTQFDLSERSEFVQVRFVVNDSLVESEIATSAFFDIDCKSPGIETLSVIQQEGDGKVIVSYTAIEDSDENLTVEMLVSDDLGNSWDVEALIVSGDIGNVSRKESYEIVWDVKEDYPDMDSTDLQVRLIVKDLYGNSDERLSAQFSIDTKSPFGMSTFEASVNAEYSVLLTWNSVEQESNFDKYEILYSTISTNLEELTEYELVTDFSLSNIDTSLSLATELEPETQYYFLIRAVDKYGNTTTLPIASASTLKEIDLEEIVISSNVTITTEALVTIQGVSVPDEYVTLVIDDGEFEEWVLADKFGYFEKTIDFIEGEYVVSVYYQDVARKILSNELTIIFDQTAPLISSLEIETISDEGYVQISGVSDPFVEILLYIDGEFYEVAKIETDAQGFWEQEIFVTESLYEAVLTVTCRDLAGNESLESTPLVLPSFLVEETEEAATGGVLLGGALQDFEYGEIMDESISDDIFEYRVSRLIDSPEVLSVAQNNTSGNIVFGGKGIPNSDVVLFVHSEEAFAIKAEVDEYGYWNYTHSPEALLLADGEHEVYAVTVDEDSSIRSTTSEVFGFAVEVTPLVLALGYIDLPTTIIALIVLVSAVFLVFYSRNKFDSTKNGKK